MRSLGSLVMASLVVFFVGMGTIWAAPPTNCEMTGSIEACMGELLDSQVALIDAAEDMLENTNSLGLFSFGRQHLSLAGAAPDMQTDLETRIETLRNEHGRAMAASKLTDDADYDELISRGDQEKGKQCKLSDIPFFESLDGANPPGLQSTGSKFGDGKCNVFNGVDDDGNAVKVNERKDNMCERVCSEKVVGGQNQKGKSKGRLIGRLMDGINASQQATSVVTQQAARISELGFVMSQVRQQEAAFSLSTRGALTTDGALAINGTDPCDSGIQIPADLIAAEAINVVIVGLDVAVIAGNIITEILDTVKDVAEDACKQDVAGFNGSSGCIPLTIAVHVAKGVTDVLNGIKSGLGATRDIILLGGEIARSFQTDTLQTCAQGIKADTDVLKGLVNGLQGSVDATNNELAVIKSELALMKMLLETNLELLLMPQGKRDGFNKP